MKIGYVVSDRVLKALKTERGVSEEIDIELAIQNRKTAIWAKKAAECSMCSHEEINEQSIYYPDKKIEFSSEWWFTEEGIRIPVEYRYTSVLKHNNTIFCKELLYPIEILYVDGGKAGIFIKYKSSGGTFIEEINKKIKFVTETHLFSQYIREVIKVNSVYKYSELIQQHFK